MYNVKHNLNKARKNMQLTVETNKGFYIDVEFDYTVTNHHERPAVLHLAPEDCCPAEFEFEFDVENTKISKDCENWHDICSEKLNVLIIEKYWEEVYNDYQESF